jgi:hypothetical protein
MTIEEDGRVGKPHKILEKPYHLSYPFIFSWQDDYYMIPESSTDKTIQLYKCTDFPLQWEFQYNIMEDIVAADATIYYYDDKWWLFVNVREADGMANWDELFLFYADSPISRNWQPHASNPVVSDVRSSRPAGNLFEKDGKLIRPSQNCSKRYGYGLKFNRIVTLNEQEYEETEVASIEPEWERRMLGVHSFNYLNNLNMSDAFYKSRK